MIRKLRIKFVCIIMAIVMLILGSVLGMVVNFTARSMRIQSLNMMRKIASAPMEEGRPGTDSESVRLPYFAVQFSPRGELRRISGGYFDLSNLDYIQKISETVLKNPSETGELPHENLRFLKSVSSQGLTVVFSDTTAEKTTLRNLIWCCLLILLAGSGIFLGISVLLSRWITEPIRIAWEQQRQFVADASHELKTPLSVIMANAELMQQEDTTESDRKQYSGNILSVTYQMRNLVENLLEIARVDSGNLTMSFEPVDFSQLVQDAVLSFQLLYEEKGLGLTLSAQDGIGLEGSEHHLYQVLDVLLDNALKYSTANATVRVELKTSGRHCVLTVDSPGNPIPKEDLKRIFKRFYRADTARAMNGSYGLGLSIAESIVKAHKGKIWAHSTPEGNRFYVQLPGTQIG